MKPLLSRVIAIVIAFLSLQTIGFSQINLDSSLVAYFKLDGNANDASSQVINGVASNTTLTNGKNGGVNKAYLFNGVDSKIDCGTDGRGIVDTITYCAWVKTTSLDYDFIVCKYDWTIDKGCHMYINNGLLALAGRNNGSVYVSTMPVGTGNFVADGNWHFVVAEVAGNSWKLWMDCNLVAHVTSSAASPDLSNNRLLTIGYYDKAQSPPERYFDGVVDEVRVYNRVLSASERSLICDITYVDPVLAAPLVSNDTTVCVNDTYTLYASPDSGTVYWQSPLGTTIGTGNSFVGSSSTQQVYHVFSVLNGIYSDTATIDVSVKSCNPFNTPFGPVDTVVCENDSVTFNAVADSGLIYWESPLGNVIGTGNSVKLAFSQTTDLYFYSVTAYGTSDTGSIMVTTMVCGLVVNTPTVVQDTTVCKDRPFSLYANSPVGTVFWLDRDSVIIGTGDTLTITLNSSSVIHALVEDNSVTSDTVQIFVSVIDCDSNTVISTFSDNELVWPNIFTPNGDGINDYFEVEIPYWSCLSGEVYNRWGQLVYAAHNMGFSWNGVNEVKGTLSSSGVYFYVIKYCVDGKEVVKNGTVQLVR